MEENPKINKFVCVTRQSKQSCTRVSSLRNPFENLFFSKMIAIFCIFSISLVRGFGDKTLPGIDVSTFSFSTIEHAIACGETFKLIDFEELTR